MAGQAWTSPHLTMGIVLMLVLARVMRTAAMTPPAGPRCRLCHPRGTDHTKCTMLLLRRSPPAETAACPPAETAPVALAQAIPEPTTESFPTTAGSAAAAGCCCDAWQSCHLPARGRCGSSVARVPAVRSRDAA